MNVKTGSTSALDPYPLDPLDPSLSMKLLDIGLYTKFGCIMVFISKIIAILVLTNQIAA